MKTKVKAPSLYKIRLLTSDTTLQGTRLTLPTNCNGRYTRDVAETKIEAILPTLPEGVKPIIEVI